MPSCLKPPTGQPIRPVRVDAMNDAVQCERCGTWRRLRHDCIPCGLADDARAEARANAERRGRDHEDEQRPAQPTVPGMREPNAMWLVVIIALGIAAIGVFAALEPTLFGG